MGVPYCIVKSKARLGTLVHKKTATAVALCDVALNTSKTFAALVQAVKANYNDKFEEVSKIWGGGIMGPKSQAMMRKREAHKAREAEMRA